MRHSQVLPGYPHSSAGAYVQGATCTNDYTCHDTGWEVTRNTEMIQGPFRWTPFWSSKLILSNKKCKCRVSSIFFIFFFSISFGCAFEFEFLSATLQHCCWCGDHQGSTCSTCGVGSSLLSVFLEVYTPRIGSYCEMLELHPSTPSKPWKETLDHQLVIGCHFSKIIH